MTSQIEICNAAIFKINGKSISSLSDNNKEAVVLTRIYDIHRKRLLRCHPWNFALKQVELAQLTSAPLLEFLYAYQLPADNLRLWRVDNPVSAWRIVGQEVHTDDDSVKVEYIADITNEGLFDSTFVDCLILRLAADMCYNITGSQEALPAIKQELAQAMREAKAYDSMEDYPRQWDNGSWIDSRI